MELLGLGVLGVLGGALTTVAGLGGGMMLVVVLSLLHDPRYALAVTAPELGEQRRKQIRADGGASADADLAGREAFDLGGGSSRLVGRDERGARVGQYRAACGGELGAAAAAHEEARPDALLEAPDGGRERGLREVRAPRGLGEGAALRDQEEMAEGVEHSQMLSKR